MLCMVHYALTGTKLRMGETPTRLAIVTVRREGSHHAVSQRFDSQQVSTAVPVLQMDVL